MNVSVKEIEILLGVYPPCPRLFWKSPIYGFWHASYKTFYLTVNKISAGNQWKVEDLAPGSKVIPIMGFSSSVREATKDAREALVEKLS